MTFFVFLRVHRRMEWEIQLGCEGHRRRVFTCVIGRALRFRGSGQGSWFDLRPDKRLHTSRKM
jgi:hypothetical protein